MSLNGDSCSTSSGCVSDLDNLSEDPSPDSPISDTISDSLHSSTNSIIKSLPIAEEFVKEFSKELLIKDTAILPINGKVEEVAEEVDELLEEELIESEIVIDCSAEDCNEGVPLNQMLINNCYELKYDIRDEPSVALTAGTNCCSAFKPSFDFPSAKSDSGQTSGHESDGTRQSDSTTSGLNGSVNHFEPITDGVFKDVNFKCLSNKSSKSDDIISNCSKTSTTSSDNQSSDPFFCCKWTNCDWPGTKDDLVDHIREIHVELQPYQQQKHNWTDSQTKAKANRSSTSKSVDKACEAAKKADSSQQYVCLWEGCKVYGKASLSRNWLERHVLEQHSGPRPFKCIVEGCGQRFKVQSALERHVNSHFKPSIDFSSSNCSTDTGSQNASISSCDNLCPTTGQLSPFELHLRQTSRATISAVRCKISADGSANHLCGNGTPNKILKRKKSTQKVRRKCFYVKSSEDFFDERVMEQVRYGLLQLNDRTGIDICGNTSTITFHSKVIARRESGKGEVNVLLKWQPNDILPDVWVAEDKLPDMKSRTVPISSIPSHRLAQLIEDNDGFERKPKTKQRRK